MPTLRWALWLVAGLAACTGGPSRERERADLLEADRKFDSVTAQTGLEGWVASFGDSGRQVDRYGDFVLGRAAIRDHMRGLLSDSSRSLRWAPDLAEVSSDGTLGYTWGRWTLTVRDSLGAHHAGQGRYLTVWRKQRDGGWLAEADIGTETEEPAPSR
jgi:ketosteroid isomerase-like protein